MKLSKEIDRIKEILFAWYMGGSDKDHLQQMFEWELKKRHLTYPNEILEKLLDEWINDEFL